MGYTVAAADAVAVVVAMAVLHSPLEAAVDERLDHNPQAEEVTVSVFGLHAGRNPGCSYSAFVHFVVDTTVVQHIRQARIFGLGVYSNAAPVVEAASVIVDS